VIYQHNLLAVDFNFHHLEFLKLYRETKKTFCLFCFGCYCAWFRFREYSV